MLSSYNISSLSFSQSLWIVTFMLKESAAGYSKITIDLTTEPELNSLSDLTILMTLKTTS